MLVAPRHRREPLVVQQVGAADHLAEPLPEDLLRGADDEPPVGGLEVLERDDRRMRRVVTPRRHEAVGRRPRADVHQLVQGRLEQRDVAVAPHAVAPGAPDPRQQGDRGGIAAGEVDEREPALRRWPAGLSGEALPAREPLHHVVVASLAGTRAGHPEARERAADDARVDVAQLLVGQPELVRLVAAEVRVHAVAGAHEIVQHLLRVGVAKVERDALLPAVERLEEERVLAVLERRHVAADVTGRGRVLELDDLGAEVCELEGAPRAGAELLDGQDSHVGEGKRHAGAPTATTARIRRTCSRKPCSATAGLNEMCSAPAARYASMRARHSSGVPTTQSRSTWWRSNGIP